MLQGPAASRRKIIDVARYCVIQHQGQVRPRHLDLGFCLSLDIRIYRECNLVGLVNRSRFRFLLAEAVAFLQGHQFQAVYAIQQLLKLAFQPLIGFHFYWSRQEQIEGCVEVLLGRFQVPALIICLASRVLLLDLRDEIGDRIDHELRSGFRLLCDWRRIRMTLWGLRRGHRGQRRGICLRWRQKGRWALGCLACSSSQNRRPERSD